MKILFCLIIISLSMTVEAQRSTTLLRVAPKNLQPAKEISELIDTTNMYASKYGNVARLTYDNMPCILPYNNTTKIPNSAKGKQTPSDIPNVWKYRDKTVPDTTIKILKPYLKHPDFYTTPNLWKKDSIRMQIIPEDKK